MSVQELLAYWMLLMIMELYKYLDVDLASMATRLILETSDGTDSVADSTDTEIKEREFRDVSQTLRYFAYKNIFLFSTIYQT